MKMMKATSGKSKMTLDKLATMTQREFLAVRKDMVTKLDLKDELKRFATKDDLKNFATKDDLSVLKDEIIDEVRKENYKVIVSNDKVVDKLDILLKEEVARTEQYKRQEREIIFIKSKIGV